MALYFSLKIPTSHRRRTMRRSSTCSRYTIAGCSGAIVALVSTVAPSSVVAEPLGNSETLCLVVPLTERHSLSAECQKILGEADIEQARFNECFRLLNVRGVQDGKCDSRSQRYILDL